MSAALRLFRPTIRPCQHRCLSTSQEAPRLPYFIPRNSRGSLPVYSDIRNGGTRYLISVRNVEGDAKALADDLTSGLFGPGSAEAQRMKVQVTRSKHLTLSGGRWKHKVMEWLTAKGF
ncbi:hypothetical protein BV25DRAFT_435544 [Artomyces pyxidatus]|uniref:Uncharacterized protein n=1 Tax=Artomyces pyxidatus TaxID=48021 RepID=A0ACB8T466_9AGAM|nr:hypothetical protein BV25DRAFT_435544 [Artomyces pyxidatus]